MNYEDFYSELQGALKELGDITRNEQKTYKNLCKNAEGGDLKSLEKSLAALEALCGESARSLAALREKAASFDARAYVEGGDFAQQLLACCAAAGIDATGDFPVYEVFPYRVRVDVENLDLYLDRKKVQCLRPASFVGGVKLARDKLLKAPFQPAAFAQELAQAYDVTLQSQSRGKPYAQDADCYLMEIYKTLTPMRRFRKDYDQQSFAFDLARLYAAGDAALEDGRRLQFGPSRNMKKAIRILDGEGREQFLATLRLYR